MVPSGIFCFTSPRNCGREQEKRYQYPTILCSPGSSKLRVFLAYWLYTSTVRTYFSTIYLWATRMPPRDFTFWVKIPVGVNFNVGKSSPLKKWQTSAIKREISYFLFFLVFWVAVHGRLNYMIMQYKKFCPQQDVPPEKLLALPGLPRCNALVSGKPRTPIPGE